MTNTHAQEHSGEVGHVVPMGILVGVWLALMVLTYVTVVATKIDLGELNLWLAMLIAVIKASLVVLYFMHLRYDKPLNSLVFVGGLVFVALFLGIALTDSAEYQPDVIHQEALESLPTSNT